MSMISYSSMGLEIYLQRNNFPLFKAFIKTQPLFFLCSTKRKNRCAMLGGTVGAQTISSVSRTQYCPTVALTQGYIL